MSKEISRRFRVKVIKKIIAHFPSADIAVYGNPAWGEEIGDYYRGNLDETGMFVAFQKTKINLNFVQPQAGEYALPMRVYDILGSRGFMLSNYRESLNMEFKTGEHLATYEEDILLPIEQFLADQAGRDYIRNSGFNKVAQCDTFLNRGKEIAGKLAGMDVLNPI